MPGRPKKKRIKAAHESPSKPNRTTRDGRTVICGNCKQVGHNRTTCKNASYVVEGSKRKRGRPRKTSVEGQSNPNPPKRRRKTPVSAAQSQSSIPAPVATDQSQSSIPSLPSAPEASSSAPLRGRGRGRPPGRGQARKETVPRGHGVYISPFSNRVFEVWGDRARDVGGSSIRGSRGRK